MNCKHTNTKYEDWPDGGEVEVCQNCGMSRHHWEWGESAWILINVEEEKKTEYAPDAKSMRRKKDMTHV